MQLQDYKSRTRSKYHLKASSKREIRKGEMLFISKFKINNVKRAQLNYASEHENVFCTVMSSYCGRPLATSCASAQCVRCPFHHACLLAWIGRRTGSILSVPRSRRFRIRPSLGFCWYAPRLSLVMTIAWIVVKEEARDETDSSG